MPDKIIVDTSVLIALDKLNLLRVSLNEIRKIEGKKDI
jgi:hypothetical protein